LTTVVRWHKRRSIALAGTGRGILVWDAFGAYAKPELGAFLNNVKQVLKREQM